MLHKNMQIINQLHHLSLTFLMLISPVFHSRESCCSCLVALAKTSARPAAVTFVQMWTSCSAETLVPASPSCCSTCTTWCPVASTRQGRAPAPWVSPPTWWRTRKPGRWSCRPEHWCWATTASAALTNLTRWATTRGLCCMRSWSSRPSPLPRCVQHSPPPHVWRNTQHANAVSHSMCVCFFSFLSSVGWNYLSTQRTHCGVGCCQPCGITVEPKEDDHWEYSASSHTPVQVNRSHVTDHTFIFFI